MSKKEKENSKTNGDKENSLENAEKGQNRKKLESKLYSVPHCVVTK